MQCQALELTAGSAKGQQRQGQAQRGVGESGEACTTIWAVPSAVAITVISNVISKLYNIMQTCGGNRRQEKKKTFL